MNNSELHGYLNTLKKAKKEEDSKLKKLEECLANLIVTDETLDNVDLTTRIDSGETELQRIIAAKATEKTAQDSFLTSLKAS